MKFYQFNQNNSGGRFDVDNKVCHRLFIQADNVDEAIEIAESLGVYFDGCETGMDCECCGDRWYRPWSDDGITFPYKYSGLSTDDAKHFIEKYGCTIEAIEKTTPNRNTQVIFNNIESFAQYLADNFGWTTPDARIFFKDGSIIEINSNKNNRIKRW
jgi:nitrogen regulatory protein PII-like uncharacterized protein